MVQYIRLTCAIADVTHASMLGLVPGRWSLIGALCLYFGVEVPVWAHTEFPHSNAATVITNSPDANTPALMTLRIRFVEDSTAPPRWDFDNGFRDYYCAAVNSMAKTIFVATEGKHRIKKVHFFRDTSSAGESDVEWYRGPDPSNVNRSSVQASCSDHMANFAITMGDRYVRHRAAVEPCGGGGDPGGCDVNGDLCIDAEEALLVKHEDAQPTLNGYCKDESGEFVLLQPWAVGRVLAHEFGHYFYGLEDEYVLTTGTSVCVGQPTACFACEDPPGSFPGSYEGCVETDGGGVRQSRG